MPETVAPAPQVLARADFPKLLDRLTALGYRVVGPTVRDGAIVYGDIRREADLPIGWTDRQDAGRYRLERRDDGALFGYNVGPHSWKKYLFPSRERLWTARAEGDSFSIEAATVEGPPFAFLGVRACEIAALRVSDAVFDGRVHDPGYRARRAGALTIAVQCGQAGGTCFCVSMQTGPWVRSGADLTLTEVLDGGRHYFTLVATTEAGRAVAAALPLRAAAPEETAAADARVDAAARSMGRAMDPEGVHDLLLGQPEHPRWEIVARRCLSCTNCTMACPTCFCHTTEEVPDLSGKEVEHWRRWDSCFNLEFSQLHTAHVRQSPVARYRQWLTHKLAGWQDQFDMSGCIGCGRCITWCPVGIDLTEEVAALRVPAPKEARR
jgi:sulfhydrogenase subunit beta (sulfur reductase)